MELIINNKKKKDILVYIFSILKNSLSQTNAILEPDHLHIEGMDKSHICLFNINLHNSWFDSYNIKERIELSFDTNTFYSIINMKSDDQKLIITKKDDSLEVEFTNCEYSKKSEYNKNFSIPLLEYDYEELSVPEIDYEVEFILSSKKLCETLLQLSNFGENLNINCSENMINLETKGDLGKMSVNILAEDTNSYAIVENEEINISYSLVHLNKMCITNKLTDEIEINLSNNCPMKISYNLGENSNASFYIAPKMND